MTPSYRLIERWVGLALDLFYRRIPLRGAIPDEGPVIVVANHPNALADPAVVARMTSRPVRFLGKEPLFRMPGVRWLVRGVGAIPVYRAKDGHDTSKNDETFRAVFSALAAGDLICLFPEGIGHNEPHLQPLKTGAARMALGAEAEHGFTLGVRIVPVGLTYADKPAFRSDCWTEVGEPIDVRTFAEAWRTDEKAAVVALTDLIAERLRDVTLNVDSWDELPLVELAEMLWRPGGDPGSPAERAQRLRDLAIGVARLKEQAPAELDETRAALSAFRDHLRSAGMGFEHLTQRYTAGVLLLFLLRHAGAMAMGLPAVAVGVAAYGLPYLLLRQVPRLLRTPDDLLATVRILGGLVIFPVWHALLAALLSWQLPWSWALPVGVVLPLCGLYAHAFFRRRKRMFRDAAVFLRLLVRPRLRAELLEERDALSRRVDALARQLAPEGG